MEQFEVGSYYYDDLTTGDRGEEPPAQHRVFIEALRFYRRGRPG